MAIAGKYVVLLALFVGMDVIAWVGWLQPTPYERREWTIQTDPSLREAAMQFHQWHDDGTLGGWTDGFLSESGGAAQTLAWFAPERPYSADSRNHF